jgi:two pore calcium channel protein
VFWAVAVAFSLPIVVAFFVEAFVKQMEKGVLLQVPQGASVFPSKSTYTRKLSYHDLYKDIVKNPAGSMSTMSI